jgi:methionyl-tRNA synthetase
MSARYKGSVLRNVRVEHELLTALVSVELPQAVAVYSKAMEEYQVDAALRAAVGLARYCNQLIESVAPWKLAKDAAQGELLDAVLYHLAESLRVVAIMLEPVIPEAARAVFSQMQIHAEPILSDAVWGLLKDGHVLGAPTPLFPRLEAPPEAA